MSDFEKLGVFYLGRQVDPQGGATLPEPLLLDSRDLVTHAVCVGMTGSGKTGLGITLLEEAALDGVPALVSRPGESARDFRARLADAARAERDRRVDELRQRYAARVAAAGEQVRRAETAAARERLADVEREVGERAAEIAAAVDRLAEEPAALSVRPRRADVEVRRVALAWMPQPPAFGILK